MKRSSILASFFLGSVPVAASLLLLPGSALAQAEIFKQLRWFQMTTTLKSAPAADAEAANAVATEAASGAVEPAAAALPSAADVTAGASAVSTPPPAAPAVDGPVWSFEQLLTQAMTHPAIQTKSSLANAAQANLEAANWQKYPTPTLEAATIHSHRPSTAFRLQQPLWTGGRITAGIDAASSRQQSADAETAETQRDIANRVVSAFAEAQRQQLRQEFAIKSVREHEKLLRLITRRVETQVSPEVDKGFAQSRLFQVMNDLSVVTQALSNALNQLSQLTGKPVLRVTPLNAENIAAPAKRAEALDQAVASSPTLARISAEEDAAAADIEAKKAAYMPQLSARYDKTFGAFGDSQVMLVLEAQPGAGLSAQSGVDAAIAKRESIRLSREVELRDLRERVTSDWDALIAARLRQENAEQARRMASNVFDSYARQYTLGRKTWIDVLNAVREAAQAEMSTADAGAEVVAATQRLRLLTGALNIGIVTAAAHAN